MASAALTGIGFDSAKLARISGSTRWCWSRAAPTSPRSKASTMRAMRPGISLEATEMTPCAPTAMAGNVSASSPDSTTKPGGTSWQTSQICVMLPEASLTPATWGIVARRTSVAGSTLQPVRPGTLYTMIGRDVASAIAL